MRWSSSRLDETARFPDTRLRTQPSAGSGAEPVGPLASLPRTVAPVEMEAPALCGPHTCRFLTRRDGVCVDEYKTVDVPREVIDHLAGLVRHRVENRGDG
jgi:hypothetical protein